MSSWAVNMAPKKPAKMPPPPGFVDHAPETTQRVKGEAAAGLKLKKAWELAYSPAKSLMMTGLMLWMSGSSVNIFSIMISVVAVFTPLKTLSGVNNVFARFDDGQTPLLLPKLVFALINLAGCAAALWKCWILGLLPTAESDWLSFMVVPHPAEQAGGGVVFS